MNKKGFTLIEILSVVILLSIIITLVATNGFGLFNTGKEKIKEQTIKEIEEGVNVFLTDIEYCDEQLNSDIFTKLNIIDTNEVGKCDDLQELAEGNVETNGDCIEIELKDLKELKYVTSNGVSEQINDCNFFTRACLNNRKKTFKLLTDTCL